MDRITSENYILSRGDNIICKNQVYKLLSSYVVA